uniref:Ribonuclease T2 n=1 Tax=Homo sapiens TaxID=9606 RepID=A0A087WWI1_HUMAN
MRPAALRGALLGCLCLALLCLGGADKRLRDNHEWKKLIMVQHWPETVCEAR